MCIFGFFYRLLFCLAITIALLCSCTSSYSHMNPDGDEHDSINDNDGGEYMNDEGDLEHDSNGDQGTVCHIHGIPDGAEIIDGVAVKGYIYIYNTPFRPVPVFAVNGCDLHVVWFDVENNSLLYSKSNDFGSTWTSERIIVSDASITSEMILEPRITAIDDYVYVIWVMNEPKKIFFISSSDNGNTWSDIKEIAIVQRGSSYSVSAVSGGLVGIVIMNNAGDPEEGIWLHKSEDHGRNWNEPLLVQGFPLGIHISSIDYCTRGNSMNIVWYDLFDTEGSAFLEVKYLGSSDRGISWSNPVLVNDRKDVGFISSDIGDIRTAIDISGSRIDLTWTECPLPDDITHDRYLFYRGSKDLGETWNSMVVLDPTADGGGWPLSKHISSSSTMVHLVTNTGYFRSSDEGASWSSRHTERRGRWIGTANGWVVIIGNDQNGIYWIRFPEDQ